MQFLTCVLILFSTPVAKTRVAPFADGVMEAAIHKRCWKSLLSRQFPRWPYHREVLSDFIEGSVYQWSPADALLEDRQSTHRQNLSPHKPFNKGESKRVKQTWSDSLDFDAFTSQKKIGRIKCATYFQVLTVMNSSCPMTHMTGMSEILTSYQPFHPEATYCGKDPEDICHPGYPSECDIVRHHVTHPQNGQNFSKKNLLKEAPECKHPLINSQLLASATCNEWTNEKASCELLGKKSPKKNTDFFVLEIQVELDIPMASAPTCQGTLTLETWNHPNLNIKCHDLKCGCPKKSRKKIPEKLFHPNCIKMQQEIAEETLCL